MDISFEHPATGCYPDSLVSFAQAIAKEAYMEGVDAGIEAERVRRRG